MTGPGHGSRLLEALQWAPLAFLCWLLGGYYLDQPMFDQWAFSAFIAKVADGTAGVADLFGYHNRVHIIALPKLIHTPLALLSGWSLKLEVFLNLALVALTFLVLRWISFLRVPRAMRHRLVVPNLLTALLLFSPVHSFDWIYSFALCIFLVNGSIIAGAFVLSRRDGELTRSDLWIAALLCTAASLSRLDGVLSWLCMIPCLLHRLPTSPRRWEYAITWSFLTLIAWGGILSGIETGGLDVSPAESILGNPLGAFTHVSILLGAPLAYVLHDLLPSLSVAVVWGPMGVASGIAFAVLAATCLWWRGADARARAVPWVSVGFYPLLYAGMNAAGRLDKGEALFVLGSMYAGVTVLLVIAVVQLAAVARSEGDSSESSIPSSASDPSESSGSAGTRFGAMPLRLTMAAVASLLALNYALEVPRLVEQRTTSHTRRVCADIVLYLAVDNTCEQVTPNGMKRLERLGFRQLDRDVTFVPSGSPAIGALEQVRPDTAAAEPTWSVQGWVAAPASAERVDVLLSLGQRERFVGHATRYSDGAGGRIEWAAELPARLRPPGASLRAWLYDRAQRRFVALETRTGP